MSKKPAKPKDWMALTPGELKRLEDAERFIARAIVAKTGAEAAAHLEQAEDLIRTVQRRQWWSTQ